MAPLARYAGRVALVTGAGSGIGRATAARIGEEGGAVAVADVDADAARAVTEEIVAAGGCARPANFDVADRAAYEAAVDSVEAELGPIDVLVNNAAVGGVGTVRSWDPEMYQRMMDVNALGVLHGIAVVGPRMSARGRGAIVTITAIAAGYGLPGIVPYTMSKGAVTALTFAAAMELAPHVRVNAVAPGKVVTPFRERMLGIPTTNADLAAIAATYPLRRVGQPEDIAAAVAFLGSDDAAFITGIVLAVDGGLTAGSTGTW
jgi:NAD(P)-dependent dehydrogenase (short-subunit alcohol dehydrogenase family)